MIDQLWVAAITVCVGLALFFTLVSTVGVLRLPDVYARAHTASQADTLGAGFALAAVALFLGRDPTTVKTVLLLFFIFVTNPTAAHAVSRAAHEEGVVPWTRDGDRSDEELAPDGGAGQADSAPTAATDVAGQVGDASQTGHASQAGDANGGERE